MNLLPKQVEPLHEVGQHILFSVLHSLSSSQERLTRTSEQSILAALSAGGHSATKRKH